MPGGVKRTQLGRVFGGWALGWEWKAPRTVSEQHLQLGLCSRGLTSAWCCAGRAFCVRGGCEGAALQPGPPG